MFVSQCFSWFLHHYILSYTLDRILSRWSRKVKPQKQREERGKRDRANIVAESARGEEPGGGGEGGQGAVGWRGEGRAFICFSGHEGGWLRHVLVVMVTFWACQRGDPSCCRLRRPETLILWISHAHGFPVADSGGGGDTRGIGFVVPRAEIIGSSALKLLDHRTPGCPSIECAMIDISRIDGAELRELL